MSAVAIALTLQGLASAASTEPVRSVHACSTVNPSDTSNPIYYPITTSSVAAEAGVAPESLLRLFMDRHSAMDYPAAAEAAMRLVAALPDRPEGHYNLACALSRLHRTDQAMAALEAAIDHGWRDLDHLSMDLDLANLRAHARYQPLIKKLEATVEAERIVPGPPRADDWHKVVEDLSSQAPALLQRYHVPGAAIVYLHGGDEVWGASFGVRDRRAEQPVEMDDVFRVRAPLHLLAVLAAHDLESRGGPQLAKLLHEAGQLQAANRGTARDAGQPRVSTVGRRVRTTASRAAVEPSYAANTAYGLLRMAVEMGSGQSFADYCRQNILRPAAMTETTFAAPTDSDKAQVFGHSRLGSPMLPDPRSDEVATGGSIYTTAADLARLIAATIQDPVDARPVEQPSASSSDVFEQVLQLSEAEVLPNSLGLALHVSPSQPGTCVQIADVGAGVGCLMRWYPQTGNGIVILFNSATGLEAAERIAHLALGGE